MRIFDDMCDMLEDELTKIVKRGDISPTELENAYKSIDIIKDIETIKAMRGEGGYSGRYDGSYNAYDGSYDGSYRNSRDYSRRRSRDNRYSRDEDEETKELRQELREMRKKLNQM